MSGGICGVVANQGASQALPTLLCASLGSFSPPNFLFFSCFFLVLASLFCFLILPVSLKSKHLTGSNQDLVLKLPPLTFSGPEKGGLLSRMPRGRGWGWGERPIPDSTFHDLPPACWLCSAFSHPLMAWQLHLPSSLPGSLHSCILAHLYLFLEVLFTLEVPPGTLQASLYLIGRE